MNLVTVKGVGSVLAKKFNLLGINTVEELIETVPKSYVDMDAAFSLESCSDGDFCAFTGKLTELSRKFKSKKVTVLHGKVISGNLTIKLIIYNQDYYLKTLKIGENYIFYGKVKIDKNITFVNPKVDIIDGKKLTGVHPVYKTRGLIPQGVYSNIVKEAFPLYKCKSVLSSSLEKECGLISLEEAYRVVHFPDKMLFYDGKERIMLEKTLKRISAFRYVKNLNKGCYHADFRQIDYSDVINQLPFQLSDSQLNAVKRLTDNLINGEQLNAILCGDVGSGKTIVAVLLAYFVIKNGYKVAFMAPTSILAKQHYSLIKSLFSSLGINVGFLTGASKKSAKEDLYFLSEAGKIDIIVGTHSLLNDCLSIPDLGLIVTDEQHRFGVAQRTKLISKGKDVAVLTMSATPIPRSLRLVAYGEVEFLTIERPRKNVVKTRIVAGNKREDMWEYVYRVCENGQQAYVIAPRIYDNEGVEMDSVEQLTDELTQYFPEEWLGVLHGKMNQDEKQSVLDAFYSNEKKVLLSTTVVEVGIDVPNATVMVICDAERFGLATLHQLRGRIGRGTLDGYCFLYTEKEPTDGLKTMVKCSNGYEIAEKDFELRGGGDIFGLEQSGSGTLEGLTLSVLNKASRIVDKINLNEIAPLLYDEIRDFSLGDVSLT